MIKIFTLVENTKCDKTCGSKHDFSFYIETKSHKILFDVGLYNPVTHEYETKQRINEIGEWLSNRIEKYYTCHCTGKKAYSQLKEVMGEKLSYLAV